MSKKLELALRIKTDMQSAVSDLNALDAAIDRVGDTSERADTAINATAQAITRSSETADQQTARLREMVRASIENANAQQLVQQATVHVTQAQEQSVRSWQDVAHAQTAAMQSHWDTVRAAEQQAIAEQHTAEAAEQAAAEYDKQVQSLNRLLERLHPSVKGLSELDKQERELNAHLKAGRIDIETYGRALDEIKNRRNAFSGINQDAKKAQFEVNSLTRSIRSVYGLLAAGVAGYGVVSFSKSIVKTTLEWDSALSTMAAATQTAGAARQELEFVKETAEDLGMELLTTAKSYSRLVAAAKETPAIQPYLHEIFTGLSSASTVLNLTTSEVDSLVLSFEQMISKGKVQSQELVLQFGQRLPGAVALAARAMNRSTEQLLADMSAGALKAEEVLPRIGRALNEAYGEQAQQASKGLRSELNRLDNTWTELKIGMGEAGFIDSLVIAMRELQEVLRDPAVREGLNELIKATGQTVSFAAQAAGQTAGFMRWVGEESAARVNGPSDDDIVRIEQAMDRVRERLIVDQKVFDETLDSIWTGANKAASQRIERHTKELDLLQARADSFYDEQNKRALLNVNNSGKPKQSDLPPLPALPPSVPARRARKTDAERELEQQRSYIKQLEKQAATLDMTSAQLREYELSEKKLTGTLLERAQAAQATIAASEQQKQSAANAKAATDLQVQLLQASGRETEAALLESANRFAEIQRDMLKTGNDVGLELVQQLIPLDALRVQLSAMQTEIDKALNTQQRREQSIEAQVNSGLITEMEGRKQLVDLHRQTADVLEKQLPHLREMAAMPGALGEQARIMLEQTETQIAMLLATTNKLQNALRDGLQNGIAESLSGLAKGTMDLRDAINALLQSVVDSMVQIASQQLAEQATSGLMSMVGSLGGMFGGGAGEAANAGAEAAGGAATAAAITSASTAGAAAMGTSITTAGAGAGTAMATSMTTAGAGAGTTMASSITTAGAAAAQAMAAAIASASAASSGGNALSSAAKVATVAAATGGHIRGPGTGTSDSIPAWLSDYEFVSRAAVVKQPGALPFLHDFNQRGMQALYDWSRRIAHHSTGGLAGIPAPAFPAPALGISNIQEPAKNMSTTLNNKIALNLIDSPERIAEALNTPAGTEALTVMLSNDPAKFRQILGVN